MARVAQGDLLAWRTLYERQRDYVFRAALRFMGNEADARDVVQDVFVSLFSRAGSFRTSGKLTTYLWRVVANRCLNERARARNRAEAPASGVAGLESVAAPEERAPDRQLEHREVREQVQRAILALPERQRLAVILSRYEGLSYEEIASALECSVSSVESLLFRARQGLAKALSPR
ncbi:MAG: sigma-70 family RNA polymerase sigma factor [Deltaproteobacteria bacterium]|nr:sigma-70 family RNA polymerase sigma factor [Deltaproteobacteria bacterium]